MSVFTSLLAKVDHSLNEPDWQPMRTAPQTTEDVRLKTDVGECIGHFACDLSGSEQPAFKGWFRAVKDDTGRVLYFAEVTPLGWAPCSDKNG